MSDVIERIESLRQEALARVRNSELDQALALFDEALGLDPDEELRELIVINKADVLITMETAGPEIQELPRIIMRRRNLRHVYLAAYALQFKHRLDGDARRSIFYGQQALQIADEALQPEWKRIVLIELGNACEMDYQISEAIEHYEAALALDAESPDNRDRQLSLGYALENIGYCKMLQGFHDEGIAFIHRAMEYIDDPFGLAEAAVDLCYGYLELGNIDQALEHGRRGLSIAVDSRQVRNSHYLLGEAAYKAGDSAGAEYHFEQLATFYPDFKHLKNLLYAIDLRGLVNLKL
jgi:tetratricopeptide (TPR) repeat protein